MEITSISPNFGMAMVKTKQAEKFINRLPYDRAMEIKVMEMESKYNPIDYYVSTVTKNGKEKIKTEVGTKTFIQTFFKSPENVIRQGKDYADKLNEEQKIQNKLTKNMNIPRLG